MFDRYKDWHLIQIGKYKGSRSLLIFEESKNTC